MADGSARPDECLDRLCRLTRLTIAIEEACLTSLSDLVTTADSLPVEEAAEWVDRIHRNRISLIKLRACAAALGIDL